MVRSSDSAFSGGGLLARWALALVAAAPCATLAAALSLADFEAELASRNGWRIAETELVLADALVRREAGNAGLRATGAFAGGALHEPQLGGTRQYGSISASAGFRYPILGSASEERLEVGAARLDLLMAEVRRDNERRAQLRQLRESFFGHAHARALEGLSRAFLADAERIREVLRQRQGAGLILEGDRRQLESAFALAERHQRGALEELRARGDDLRSWRRDFSGEVLAVSPAQVRLAGGEDLGEAIARRAAAGPAGRLGALRSSLPQPLTSARGSLFVIGTVRRDTDLGNAGALVAGVSLDLPLSTRVLEAMTAEQEARLERARLAFQREEEDERVALLSALANADRSMADLKLARVRVAASGAALVESARRARIRAGTDDAPIERWLRARSEHYQALVALLEAEHQQSLSGAMLELAVSDLGGIAVQRVALPECREAAQSLLAWHTLEASAPAGGPLPPCVEGASLRVARAFYAWRGTRALERAADEAFWRTTGASELWLSFSGEEIERLRQPAPRAALREALVDLQRRGHRLTLLLGEPTWLRAGQDERLFALLREFSDLPFGAIHLDVEPDQLDPPLPPQQAWLALGRIVQRTRELAHKPVILSLNWRALLPESGGPCRGCAAARAADEIAVMLYTTSPEVAAQRMQAILASLPAASHPAPRVWLAHSIEPALGRDESFATGGRAALDEQFGRLSDLASTPAFAGFAIQSLEDFLEAPP